MPTNHTKNHLKTARQLVRQIFFEWWPKRGWGRRILIGFLTLLAIWIGGMYAIAQWYIHSQNSKPITYGVSFIPAYAESLGLDPQETMDALLGIGVRHFRLVSYWNQVQPESGTYDYSQLDWQFEKAEKAGAKIDLTVGLRQPRWPECHEPDWAVAIRPNEKAWQKAVELYVNHVVNRYKSSPALESYQLENEYFLKGFGTCTDWSRDRLIAEYDNIKSIDPHHPVVIGRSNNALGFPVGKPTPDEWGISIYKRVWDAGVTKRYLEYPFPAWFYGFLAGTQKLVWDRDMMIAELQAEPWPPDSQSISAVSLAEQNKSFDAKRFEGRFQFAEGTGMKKVYLWGAEYWYYRKVVLHDDSIWRVAQQHFQSE
jgi:hypothetical protein